jgi:hypothetical protein
MVKIDLAALPLKTLSSVKVGRLHDNYIASGAQAGCIPDYQGIAAGKYAKMVFVRLTTRRTGRLLCQAAEWSTA